MRRGRVLAGVAVVLLLGGGVLWRFGAAASPLLGGSPHLDVSWRGRYQGRASLPVTVSWCPVTRLGVVEGVAGDSGVVVVLYERDSLAAGAHPVAAPEIAAAGPRPAASVVLRWMRTSPDTALAGFKSQGGTVRLQLANGRASGDINAWLRSVSGPDSLLLQGTFNGVPVITSAKGCT